MSRITFVTTLPGWTAFTTMDAACGPARASEPLALTGARRRLWSSRAKRRLWSFDREYLAEEEEEETFAQYTVYNARV